MNITAIICEYNPFHTGHARQIEELKRKGDLVVCVMSGGFVQRGEPALFCKYDRAKAAVLSGADLVLELPFPYCCSAAEFFAFGGVSLVDSLGVVGELRFGSECCDIELLKRVGERVLSGGFIEKLRASRADARYRNVPFASLRERVYEEYYGEKLPVTPNDILGVEYINALTKLKSKIIPSVNERVAGYSATAFRRLILDENRFDMTTDGAEEIFKASDMYRLKNIERAILAYYRTADVSELERCEGMTNGLAGKLKKRARDSADLEDFLEGLSEKNYANARIRRAIVGGMTRVTPEMLKERPRFTQVLAVGREGRRLIRLISRLGDIELLSKPAHIKRLTGMAREQAEFSFSADALLTLACDRAKEYAYFIRRTPFILKGDRQNDN